jgi:hypothetical protein
VTIIKNSNSEIKERQLKEPVFFNYTTTPMICLVMCASVKL